MKKLGSAMLQQKHLYLRPYIYLRLEFMCLKESYFPDSWKVSSVVPVFKNMGKGLQLKTTTLSVFFMWLVKSLKNL